MSDTQQTSEEIFDSLTGFDEMAISQHFGRPIGELAATDSSMFGRALVFVLRRREGASDDDARNAALALTIKEYTAVFADAKVEADVVESGKDEQPDELLEEQPTSSLASVS